MFPIHSGLSHTQTGSFRATVGGDVRESPGKSLYFSLLLVLVASMTAVADDAIPAGILDDGGEWVLSDPWRYRPGDDPAWISPELDDSGWLLRTTTYYAYDPAWDGWKGVGWFRNRFSVDPDLVGVPLTLRTRHAGSLQVFVDGTAIEPGRANLVLDGSGHIIVVRYENSKIKTYHCADFPAGFEVAVSGSGAIRDLDRQLRLGAAMKTATEVGGDYYDLHIDPSGELTVVIGDATGHGMRAGTLVVAVKSMFSALGGSLPPAGFLQRCSTLIKNLNLGRMHMAMMVVRVQGRTARIAAAGIPPALVFRAETGVVDEVSLHGLPLGTGMDPRYEECEVQLAPGDTILLSTDGLAELNDPQGNALGYDGIAEVFAAVASKAPGEIVGDLLAKAASWRNGATQEDDMTCVVLQCRGLEVDPDAHESRAGVRLQQ